MRIDCFIAVLAACAFLTTAFAAEPQEQVTLPEPLFHFDILGTSEPVEHVFQFKNNTQEMLAIGSIKATPPLMVPNISARVPPGQEGMLRFRLGEPRPVGEYEGLIEVGFKNPGISNISFEITGKITPFIEGKPFPAFFVATGRGQTKEATIELINHESQPLRIEGLEYASERFKLRLTTNEPGQRYAVSLTLSGVGKAGRLTEAITLRTSSKKQPILRIPANTIIYERVHTFPDEIDFGIVDAGQARAQRIRGQVPTQVLMAYCDGCTNFLVTATTDLPFAEMQVLPAPTGRQVQVEVKLKPEHLNPGEFEGRVELRTNDPEFPKLEIPVKGEVIDR